MSQSSPPTTDGRSRMLWIGLVLALAVAMGAGVWSALSRREGAGSQRGGVSKTGTAGAADPSHDASAASSTGAGDSNSEWGPLPAFALTERSGRTVRSADLAGKVWIANFIFTRCPNVCPDLTRKMADVRHRLREQGADDILSVSISVDPVYDTPSVLSAYADSFKADSPSWLFLTGDPDAVVRLVNDGFHLIMNDPKAGAPAHSNRFVIVDADGRVNATHLGSDPGVVDQLVKEALALRKVAPAPSS